MKRHLILTLLMTCALYGKEVSLLNGSLTMELPDEAKLGKRTTGLMESGPGSDETLYWVGDGDKRIAVHAKELYEVHKPGSVEEARQKHQERAIKADIELNTLGDNILYSLVKESRVPRDGDNVYSAAVVISRNGIARMLTFVFARDVAKDVPSCRKFVLDALASVKDGVEPDLSARVVPLRKISCGESQDYELLSFPMPAGYMPVQREGADFTIYVFHELHPKGTLGSTAQVYVGHRPTTEELDACTNKRKGTMFGKEMEWGIFPSTPDNKYHTARALVPLKSYVSGKRRNGRTYTFVLYACITLHADTPEKLETLITAAEGMTLTPVEKG